MPEYLFCEIQCPGTQPVFVGVVYRPPGAPFVGGEGNKFIEDLQYHMHQYTTKILIGDFNANQLARSTDSDFVRRLMGDNSFQSIPYGATFHTETCDSALDLCLVDVLDTVTSSWKTDSPFAGGHDLIAATISIPMPSVPPTEFSFRDFKNLNARGLCEYLRESDWSIFDSQPTLEQALSTLYENLFKAIDTHVPIKVVNTSKRKHPWFTSEHQNMIKERDRLYRRFDLTRHRADLMFYRAMRDATHQSIENARLDYYANRHMCVISD